MNDLKHLLKRCPILITKSLLASQLNIDKSKNTAN